MRSLKDSSQDINNKRDNPPYNNVFLYIPLYYFMVAIRLRNVCKVNVMINQCISFFAKETTIRL